MTWNYTNWFLWGSCTNPRCEPCEPCGPPVGLGDKSFGCTLFNDRIRQLEVKLVSNETSKGINHAVNSIIEHRSGMDVRLGSIGGALQSHENQPGSDQGFRMKGVWKGSRCFFGPKLAVNSVGYLSYLPISSNFGLWLKSSSNSIPSFPRRIRGLHITIAVAVISWYPNLYRLLPWLCPPNTLTAPRVPLGSPGVPSIPQVRGGRGQRREVRLHPAAPGPFRGEIPAGQSGAMRPALPRRRDRMGMTEGEAPKMFWLLVV